MTSCPPPQKMAQRNGNVPALSGVKRSRETVPGMMSVRILKSGALKPITTSGAVNSSLPGSPFFSSSVPGRNTNLRATTLIARSLDWASTIEPAAAPATSAAPPNNMRRREGFIALRLRHRQFGDCVLLLAHLGLDFAEAQPPIGIRRVPLDRVPLGLRARCGQRENERLRRVVRDVARHVVMLLVDVAIEHRHVGKRHQQVDRLRAIASRPVPRRG